MDIAFFHASLDSTSEQKSACINCVKADFFWLFKEGLNSTSSGGKWSISNALLFWLIDPRSLGLIGSVVHSATSISTNAAIWDSLLYFKSGAGRTDEVTALSLAGTNTLGIDIFRLTLIKISPG